MLRIAYITYEFMPDVAQGGVGTYVKQISNALAAAGCDVHVFAGSFYNDSSYVQQQVNIHCIKCNDPFDFRDKVVATFEKIHTTHPFDIIESAEIHGNGWEIKKKLPAT